MASATSSRSRLVILIGAAAAEDDAVDTSGAAVGGLLRGSDPAAVGRVVSGKFVLRACGVLRSLVCGVVKVVEVTASDAGTGEGKGKVAAAGVDGWASVCDCGGKVGGGTGASVGAAAVVSGSKTAPGGGGDAVPQSTS